MSEVSVIIPCFNHGEFLQEAIDSVRSQTVPVREIIVVDDGSTDDATRSEIRRVRALEGVQVLEQENAGPSVARNRGIECATGEFIVSLDADDRLKPVFVEKLLPLIAGNPGVGIVYGQAYTFGEEAGLSSLPPYRFPDVLLDPCIYSTAIFRRADWVTVGGYREEMKSGWEDFEFWLSIIELGRSVEYLPEPVFDYRKHAVSRDGDFSGSRDRVLDTFEKIFRHHRELYSDNIRLLFEAHWERLEWRRRFCEPLEPQLGFLRAGELDLLSADSLVCEADKVTAVFALPDSAQEYSEFRLDPFHGPGRFTLLGVSVESSTGVLRTVDSQSISWLDHSFGTEEKTDDGVSLFFIGWDAHLRFRFQDSPGPKPLDRLHISYRVQRGAGIVPAFFSRLGEMEREFNAQVERLRGADLELLHVKNELHREMAARRHAQRNWGYRLTRPISRWLEGRKKRK